MVVWRRLGLGLALAALVGLGVPPLYRMAEDPWEIEGFAMTFCPCDTPCPCRSAGHPTHGHCEATTFVEIARGFHGDVRLDGLRFVAVGDMHRAGWSVVYAEERTPAPVRDAMMAIGASMATSGSYFAPWLLAFGGPRVPLRLVSTIESGRDDAARERWVEIPGILELRGRLVAPAGVERERVPALDELSNWVSYGQNISYRFDDAEIGRSFDWSGRQLNWKDFRLSDDDYRRGGLLIQHGSATDAASVEARGRILTALRRSGALRPAPPRH